jgi:hypothetical protein
VRALLPSAGAHLCRLRCIGNQAHQAPRHGHAAAAAAAAAHHRRPRRYVCGGG